MQSSSIKERDWSEVTSGRERRNCIRSFQCCCNQGESPAECSVSCAKLSVLAKWHTVRMCMSHKCFWHKMKSWKPVFRSLSTPFKNILHCPLKDFFPFHKNMGFCSLLPLFVSILNFVSSWKFSCMYTMYLYHLYLSLSNSPSTLLSQQSNFLSSVLRLVSIISFTLRW